MFVNTTCNGHGPGQLHTGGLGVTSPCEAWEQWGLVLSTWCKFVYHGDHMHWGCPEDSRYRHSATLDTLAWPQSLNTGHV
jgi:hypothetical protein